MAIGFQISMYGLACTASMMLAVSEGAVFPAALTVPMAILALFFTERWKSIQLSTAWANSLGLVAFAAASVEFFSESIEARLLSGAHLLVYLTWIGLFQKKSARQYWWMCALGVLQVAVASVLTSEGLFGLLLTCYVFLSVWTLSVFSLHQARERHANAEQFFPGNAADVPFGPAAHCVSVTRGSIQNDPRERWINGRFVGGVLGTASMSMLIGIVFFMLIPRMWIGKFTLFGSEPDQGVQPLTGFTEEVRLGDIGQILESTELVLEVMLFDDKQPLDVEEYARQLGYDEPLFRGSVLADYRNGRWSKGPNLGANRRLPIESGPGMLRQQIRMQPIGTEIVFAMHPVNSLRLENAARRVAVHSTTSVLIRPREMSTREVIAYDAFSPKATPGQSNSSDRVSFQEMTMSMRRYRELPPVGLERLIALANQKATVAANADGNGDGGDSSSQLRTAKRLEAYLRDSVEFSYSLDTSIQDPRIDPIEDFLFNRKQGHCEYFASSLALMLRAVGIPSRLVSGFKGGSTNQFSGQFVVQQRHAHAWVEAYVDGRWIVLDATPASRAESVRSMAARLPSWQDLLQVVSDMWSFYVVKLSLNQQRTKIYAPLQKWALGLWQTVQSYWIGISSSAAAFLLSPDRWFSWQGFVVAWVALFSLSLVVWLIRRLVSPRSQVSSWFVRLYQFLRSQFQSDSLHGRQYVEFYERFQRLLARQGFVRGPTQTQREFSLTVQQELQKQLAASGIDELPFDVAEFYYRVRFGSKPLAAGETTEISRQLKQLEDCLTADSRR